MEANSKIRGVWTALVTPFTEEGAIDYAAWDRLVLLQKEAGITGIVVSGSTGEGSTLSVAEKLSLMKRAKAVLGKSLEVMGGIGGSDTAQCVELGRLYEDAGADSLLVVTPPYNKPSLAGLKLHFSSIANKVKIPICLYHVPGRTGQRLNSDSLSELCKIPSVTMVKEASGDVTLFAEAAMNSDAAYFSGDDLSFIGSLAYGGVGVISVISNIFPREWVALTEAYWNCDFKKVQALNKTFFPLNKNLYCEGNPTPLKAVMEELNLCKGYVRAPLAPVTSENRAMLRGLVQKTMQQLNGSKL
jgi:4-hydroxy-tetrahydrodipicolinate synthase